MIFLYWQFITSAFGLFPLNASEFIVDNPIVNISSLGLVLVRGSGLEFSSYLTGLVEGDGSIVVPAEETKSYRPFFEIVFHIQDKILAETIQLKVGGTIQEKESYCRLLIRSTDSVIRVIHLLNGNMRSPKIEALHRMIKWYNLNYNYDIKLLPLTNTPLNSDSWLSGFIDADGSFYLNWLFDKKDRPGSLQYYMRISQRQDYHRESAMGNSYFNLMSKISKLLSVPLRSRTRVRKNNYVENSYEVRSGSYLSNYIILSYLLRYPLFSYKYRAVPIQIELLQLSKNKKYKLSTGLDLLNELKLKLTVKLSDLDSDLAFKYKKEHLNHIFKYFSF